jgi:hypothetical protein
MPLALDRKLRLQIARSTHLEEIFETGSNLPLQLARIMLRVGIPAACRRSILEDFGLPGEIAARDSIAIGDEIGGPLQRCLDRSVITVVLHVHPLECDRAQCFALSRFPGANRYLPRIRSGACARKRASPAAPRSCRRPGLTPSAGARPEFPRNQILLRALPCRTRRRRGRRWPGTESRTGGIPAFR